MNRKGSTRGTASNGRNSTLCARVLAPRKVQPATGEHYSGGERKGGFIRMYSELSTDPRLPTLPLSLAVVGKAKELTNMSIGCRNIRPVCTLEAIPRLAEYVYLARRYGNFIRPPMIPLIQRDCSSSFDYHSLRIARNFEPIERAFHVTA